MSAVLRFSRSRPESDQLVGVAVQALNDARIASQQAALAVQDAALDRAMEQLERVGEFIGSPESILGSELTKHGEIAEQLEVGVRNARAALQQQELPATFEGIGRTAPADYLIDGVEVQSKFINGVNGNLSAVLDHMEQYPEFGRDGSYYHIPRDTHEAIKKIMAGDHGELSERTVRAVREKVQRIEQQSGKPFEEVVKPGVSEYAEVQQGRVHQTLEGYQKELEEEQAELQEKIRSEHAPSLAGALKAAGIAAGISGGVTLAASLYSKYRAGKNPFAGDFTAADWQEVGIDTGKAAAGGAVAGGALYLLTNYAEMPAPFAAAVISAAKGVAVLAWQFHAGEISSGQFAELGLIACVDAAVVGLATAAGQALIPIPLLGPIIGMVAGRFLSEFVTGQTAQLAQSLRQDMVAFLEKLDAEKRRILIAIDAEFDKLGRLTAAAFDLERNRALLASSVALAAAYGVAPEEVLDSHAALDNFMLA